MDQLEVIDEMSFDEESETDDLLMYSANYHQTKPITTKVSQGDYLRRQKLESQHQGIPAHLK